MTPDGRKNLTFFAGLILLVALCLIFPNVLRFVELAAREIRFLWWQIAALVLILWFARFFLRKKD